MKKNKLSLYIVCALLTVLLIKPLYAENKRHEDYNSFTRDVIKATISMQVTSADLGIYSMNNIHLVVLEEMRQNPLIQDVGYPRLAPDHAMVFIPYFLKNRPTELRFIMLYCKNKQLSVWIYNLSKEAFNKFTEKRYKTRFHYIPDEDSAE